MVKLRLTKVGRHKLPIFRLVAVDSKAKSNGSYLVKIGEYNPGKDIININEYLAIKWLSYGAVPTDTARSLLRKKGIIEKFTNLKAKKELDAYLASFEPQKTVVQKPAEPKKEKPKKVEQPKKPEPKKVEQPKQEEVKKVEQPKKPEPKKDTELSINLNSKLVSKYTEEEILKRESKTYSVTKESEIQKDAENNHIIDTIMISLDKKYIENIINEEKEVIFLKKLPILKVNRVVIYAIKPIGKVIGEFDIKAIHTLSKTKAWKEYGSKSVFMKKEFDEYYSDYSDDAKVIEIDGFIKYSKPKELSDFKISKGPSGFSYLK